MRAFLKRSIGCMLLSIAIIMSMLAVPQKALASGIVTYSRPDITKKGSIELCYHNKDIIFNDVQFRVYRVADISDSVKFTLTSKYSKYPVTIKDSMSNSDWMKLAQSLTGYIERDGVRDDYSDTTGNNGRVTFDNLSAGLYLIVGERHEYDDTDRYGVKTVHKCTPVPFLISLPSLSSIGEWMYDISTTVKFDSTTEEYISRRVLKVWDDSGYSSNRPSSVTFDLLRNGRVYDTVTLRSRDSWRYQWDDLSTDYTWRIVEREPGGRYYTSGSWNGITYVVTNTYEPPYTPPYRPPVTPNDPPTPPINIDEEQTPLIPNPPGTPEENTNTDTIPKDPSNPDIDIPEEGVPLEKLPQTGQLWWPVPLMAFGGMVLFCLGFMQNVLVTKSRRKNNEE